MCRQLTPLLKKILERINWGVSRPGGRKEGEGEKGRNETRGRREQENIREDQEGQKRVREGSRLNGEGEKERRKREGGRKMPIERNE
jgi:hypothetical protein